MFDEESNRSRITLIAGLILVIVLAAVAAISGESTAASLDEIAGARATTNTVSGTLLARALQ
ncbi:MAG: hypothetical protein P8Y93_14095, partial [Acidobacteriota bacterium]